MKSICPNQNYQILSLPIRPVKYHLESVPMRENKTLSLLRQNKPAIGLWLHSHHFHTARILAAQNLFDWLLVDMEHTPADLSTVSTIMAAIADVSAGSCTPLARIASGTIDQIKQALDAGAQGIIVPMINTAEEAAQVVQFARYPPDGVRGAGGLTPQYGFGTANHVEYVGEANRQIMVSVQIETAEAVENIDAILAVEGLDMVFLGPFDLHISLGLPAALWSDNPTFQAAAQRVIAACKAKGMSLGTIAPNAAGATARAAEGFTFLSLGTDYLQLLSILRSQVSEFNESI